MRRLVAATLGMLAVPLWADAQAAPGFGAMFQDHAVLQRDRPIPVWGHAAPGETVGVVLGEASASATADASGAWSVSLPAHAAGGPFDLSLHASSGATQTLHDILVGDVWLCSGQSNMVLEVNRALNAPREIANSADPQMRLMTVGLDSSPVPLAEFRKPIRWAAAAPETVAGFSAACFYFGQQMRRQTDAPVGLVTAAWGGSTIQSWMSEKALSAQPGFGELLSILKDSVSNPSSATKRWSAIWESWWTSKNTDAPWMESGADWASVPAMTAWETWGAPALAAYNGIVWYRVDVELTAAQAAQVARLSLGPIDEVDQTWVNGQPVGASGSGDRVYDLPAGTLKAGRNSIVMAVLDTYAFGGVYGPAEKRVLTLADGVGISLDGVGWRYKVARAGLDPPPRAPWESLAGLTTIANGMIAPMHAFGFKGVLWYQGEANTDRQPQIYDRLLAGFMQDWRERFGADLPFLILQLANYGPPSARPGPSAWAEVRDRQRLAVKADKHAALAVAVDLGEWTDIHPANKQEVSRRLARAARHLVYGDPAPPSGPEVASAVRSGEAVVVRFTGVTGSLKTLSSERAIGFELCDAKEESCRYVAGRANGSSVTLPAASAAKSAMVRFCWADSPVCNLYDAADLPAGPFRLRVK